MKSTIDQKADIQIPMSESALLDCLLEHFKVKTDVALARHIGLTSAGIYLIRFRMAKLSIRSKLLVIGSLPQFLPLSLNSRLLWLDNLIESAGRGLILDGLKRDLRCKSDFGLATVLALSPTSVSLFRSGRLNLGVGSKLRILRALDGLKASSMPGFLGASTENAVLCWDKLENVLVDNAVLSHFLSV